MTDYQQAVGHVIMSGVVALGATAIAYGLSGNLFVTGGTLLMAWPVTLVILSRLVR